MDEFNGEDILAAFEINPGNPFIGVAVIQVHSDLTVSTLSLDLSNPDEAKASGDMPTECTASILAAALRAAVGHIHSGFHEATAELRGAAE